MGDPEGVGNQSREECEEGIERMMTNTPCDLVEFRKRHEHELDRCKCCSDATRLADELTEARAEIERLAKQKVEMIRRFEGLIGVGKDERNFVVLWIEENEENIQLRSQITGYETACAQRDEYASELTSERDRLREALEFYGDEENYDHAGVPGELIRGKAKSLDEWKPDEGKIARAATEGK